MVHQFCLQQMMLVFFSKPEAIYKLIKHCRRVAFIILAW